MRVALPTLGGPTSVQYLTYVGTAVNTGAVNNPTYDDLAAIWDAHNGTSTTYSGAGVPGYWAAGGYWSSTPFEAGHAVMQMATGEIGLSYFGLSELFGLAVAFQVL